jgi:hypothetical protein
MPEYAFALDTRESKKNKILRNSPTSSANLLASLALAMSSVHVGMWMPMWHGCFMGGEAMRMCTWNKYSNAEPSSSPSAFNRKSKPNLTRSLLSLLSLLAYLMSTDY